MNIQKNTKVIRETTNEVRYEKKSWFIFTWYERKNVTKLRDDLIIVTTEDFDKIILYKQNGQGIELVPKVNGLTSYWKLDESSVIKK